MNKRRLALGILLAVCLAAAGWGIFALIRGNDTNQHSANGTVAPTSAGAATEAPTPTDEAGTVTPTTGEKPDDPAQGSPTQAAAKTDRTKPAGTIPVTRVSNVSRATEGELAVTWLGHSSVLVQMGGINLLFDPVFSEKAGLLGVGPKRFSEAPMSAEDTPPIDILYLSHDHYDHMDYDTIMALDGRVSCYVVPNGMEEILAGWGIAPSKVHPMAPWEETVIAGIRIALTPAQHSGGRGLGKSTLCSGIFLSDGAHTLYYTGDGGYGAHFARIGESFGPVDLLLVESGQYNESWAKVHMMPEQSMQVALDVKAAWTIPIHWGTFVLAMHDWDEPPARDTELAAKMGISLATPRIGQRVNYTEIANYTEKWWETVK